MHVDIAHATNRYLMLTEILYCVILSVFVYIILSNVCCIVTVSTLHGALCLVRALIFLLFLCFFCSCECLSCV